MAISGKHIKIARFVQTEEFIVALDVDAVIPDEDPSEPCFEPAAVQFLLKRSRTPKAGDTKMAGATRPRLSPRQCRVKDRAGGNGWPDEKSYHRRFSTSQDVWRITAQENAMITP